MSLIKETADAWEPIIRNAPERIRPLIASWAIREIKMAKMMQSVGM